MSRIIIKDERKAGSRIISRKAEYFVKTQERDFHTEHGSIPKDSLESCGTHQIGKETFRIYPATFADEYKRLERGVQIIGSKDLGLIICETGLTKDSVILDIGIGSGAVSSFLSRLAKKIYAYDIVQNNLDRSTKNVEELGIKENVEINKGDAYKPETIKQEDEIDIFILDVPEPWRALSTAKKVLKKGGYLVGYTPCITQANQLVDALGDGWHHEKTVELIEREWKVKGKAVRPMTKDFSHTAFLSFIRKIQ